MILLIVNGFFTVLLLSLESVGAVKMRNGINMCLIEERSLLPSEITTIKKRITSYYPNFFCDDDTSASISTERYLDDSVHTNNQSQDNSNS